MKKIGMTLGKFAPLHRGHRHVIETSLAEMDHTLVLIYDCPELDVCPLPVRAQWIRDLYPQVEVLEIWDGPTQIGLDPAVTAEHDAYLKRKLAGRGVTHFYCSELYGVHVSQALGAVDRRVDLNRTRFNISATSIRNNPFEYRQFLSPRVLQDLIIRVVFLGAPSTGKSTLTELLAKHFKTVHMPEYGREFWELHQTNRRLTQVQLLEIAIEHRRREDQLLSDANRYLFIDTDATTTLQFSYYYHDAAHPELVRLASQTRDRYDHFFLCDSDFPYCDTWDRSGAVSRDAMQRRITQDLLARRIPFQILSGPLSQRVSQVIERLSASPKFSATR